MKIKQLLLIILSRVIRGAGMGLGASGILFSVCFFSFHLMRVNIYGVHFQLLSFLLVMLYIGLLTHMFMMNGMKIINIKTSLV
ncbi:hypothetical protein EC847_11213 [Scandinavium goeteborgense]|uniref:Uncharacterized protein n=1 Tax=Scandinavium goeteborgense TaxID=1851514 RepID=A0A4R6EEQ2_SCAGO|nr:hypothetical protein EC847_11213 [Scandinavium goeteborgense]